MHTLVVTSGLVNIKVHDFEIQEYDTSGDTSMWFPVSVDAAASYVQDSDLPQRESAFASRGGTASSVVTATGLKASTGYRFRVRARSLEGAGVISAVSDIFTTGA